MRLCTVSNFEQDVPLQELTSPVVLLVRSKQRSGSCEVASASATAVGWCNFLLLLLQLQKLERASNRGVGGSSRSPLLPGQLCCCSAFRRVLRGQVGLSRVQWGVFREGGEGWAVEHCLLPPSMLVSMDSLPFPVPEGFFSHHLPLGCPAPSVARV